MLFTRELGKILSPEHFSIFAIVDCFFFNYSCHFLTCVNVFKPVYN